MRCEEARAWFALLSAPFVAEASKIFSAMLRWRNIGRFVWTRAVPSAASIATERFLFCASQRRRFQNDRLRPDMATDFRRSTDWIGRRDRGFGFNPDLSMSAVARMHRPDLVSRRRRLQIDGCGERTWTHLGLRDGSADCGDRG